MKFREFIKDVMSDSQPEPFCPLDGGYCNVAYEHCMKCTFAKRYAREKGIELEDNVK